jgi:hypothetical protein
MSSHTWTLEVKKKKRHESSRENRGTISKDEKNQGERVTEGKNG